MSIIFLTFLSCYATVVAIFCKVRAVFTKEDEETCKFLIRPFHKLPGNNDYDASVFTTYIDEKGVSHDIYASEITSSNECVTLGEAGKETWYVVTGADVTLSQGAICYGDVRLILADGAKLTATGGADQAGITVSGEGNSLTIYGQTAQSGQLEANGGENGAGIGGGGLRGSGVYITINGGKVTANGGTSGAGIGGGAGGNGLVITINGGTVTANGGKAASAIGSGHEGKIGIYITVATTHIVKADGNNPPTTVIENTGDDLALSLAGKQYATITEPYFNITANQDPDHKTHYYSTFYSRTCDYQVPSDVTAYTGAVDGNVLKLTPIASGIIPTGEAVILKLTSEENITAPKKQFDLTAMTTTATKSDTNELKGTDVAKTLGANDYALSLGQHGVGFYLWEGKSIGAHKAYLTLNASAGAKAFIFQFDDDPTGIEEASPISSP